MKISIFDETVVAVVGKTGSGKSYAIRGIVESFLNDQQRVCILDPTGVWWGIRSMADGSAGFGVVVLGGDHGVLPLTVDNAEALGTLIGTTNTPAVIDMSHFSHAEHARFATKFLEALFLANREPLRLIVDEADTFAPQNPQANEAAMLGRMNAIARRGRVKGFRSVLITQRPQVLAKNVLSQAGAMITMKLTSPQDRKAIGAWIEGQADVDAGKQVLASLPKLETGEGWVWSPAHEYLFREKMPEITTFNSMKTPEVGDAKMRVVPALINIEAIRAALAPIKEVAPQQKLKAVEDRADACRRARAAGYEEGWRVGCDEGYRGGFKDACDGLEDDLKDVLALKLKSLRDTIDGGPSEKILRYMRDRAPRTDPKLIVTPAPSKVVTVTQRTPITYTAPNSGLTKSEQRVLDALNWWDSISVTPTRHQVAFVAGYTVNGHFNNQVTTLKMKELIEYRDGSRIAIREDGTKLAAAPRGALNRDALIERVRGVLKGEPLVKVFDSLVDMGGGGSRADLAEQSGYTVNGHFNNQVSTLVAAGIAVYPRPGEVGLSSMFDLA